MRFLAPQDYQPQLEKTFSQLKDLIHQSFSFVEVEHIGSSAIKGAFSKGDLDILVRVSKNQFDEVLKTLNVMGFLIKEDTLRTESLCMLVGSGSYSHVAIQLIENGSEFEMFVTFRDLLNNNAQLVEKYNQLKLKCAGLPPQQYRKIKSQFIEEVLRGLIL